MRVFTLYKLLSLALVHWFAFLSWAANQPGTPVAMLHTGGKVEVNGVAETATTALVPGDWVETYDDSVASITTVGTSILLMPNSSVQLEHNAIELRQGDVAISTSNAMAVRADDLTIMPATRKPSRFEIADNENSVTIAARQGSLNLSEEKESSTVQEGQQSTRKKKKKKTAAAIAARGPMLSAQELAVLAGAAGIAIVTILIVQQGPKNCVSPAGDKNCRPAP